MNKEVVYIDMDGVLCDFHFSYTSVKENNPDIDFPQSQEGFYLNLNPIKDSLDAMESMIKNNSINPYILTSPSIYNPLCYTEKRLWVEKNLGFEWVKRLIISPNKSLLIGDILIDDNMCGHGQDKFNGELILFGSDRFDSWKSVMNYINGK